MTGAPATTTTATETHLVRLDAAALLDASDDLAELLVETVRGGSSVGFLADLDRATAAAWWRGLAPAVTDRTLAIWVVRAEGHGARCVAGTVGVAFTDKPNGRHRAEVTKLMVHPSARGQGLARALLDAAERAAAEAGVTLLVLDTETGSPAETVYGKAGWTAAGTIPDYAADPTGTLHPTTLFYKRLGADRVDTEPDRAARQ
ncbi:GNAT family N-acetyltransferase [Streptomyces sp. NPDC029674]|uniref:GNAT family N-acetyltransferase n=1 Tax=Streptomyces sp. NPDC029674 TaxID=3365297 RepID=UPI0038510C13